MNWCAECGKPWVQLPHGSWARCCNDLGYWSLHAPTPEDSKTAHALGMAPHMYQLGKKYHLYRKPKWPKGQIVAGPAIPKV